jgi:rhodanese-related sulfurtransferase
LKLNFNSFLNKICTAHIMFSTHVASPRAGLHPLKRALLHSRSLHINQKKSASMALKQPVNDSSEHRKEELAKMVAKLASMFNDVQHVPVSAAGGRSDHLIVDVRTAEERSVSMIPGAISQEQFERSLMSSTSGSGSSSGEPTFVSVNKDTKILVCCTIGYRSSQHARKLRVQGYDAANLEGGIVAWTQEGLPLMHRSSDGKESPTTEVHVFGKQWALQGDGYQPVMFDRPYLAFAKSLLASSVSKLKASLRWP